MKLKRRTEKKMESAGNFFGDLRNGCADPDARRPECWDDLERRGFARCEQLQMSSCR